MIARHLLHAIHDLIHAADCDPRTDELVPLQEYIARHGIRPGL